MRIYLKTYEAFRNDVPFYRFSKNEITTNQIIPQKKEITFPNFVQILTDMGYPDLGESVHFMDELALNEKFIFQQLYGRFLYKVIPDTQAKLGWSFLTQINNWWYHSSNQYNYLKNRNELVKKLDDTGFRTNDLEELPYEESYKEVLKLEKFGLIGKGTINELLSTELWGKEKVFVWTDKPISIVTE